MESIRMKTIWTENNIEWKTAFICFFLTKPNGKCTHPIKKVVISDIKCTWSNVNLGDGNVIIEL